ncbi:MAG: bactofilin family protein, partial [Anaerolineae bacterium]
IRGERVEILSTGRVIGDVDVIDLLLDEGGVVRGHVIMRKDQAPQLQPLDLSQSTQTTDSTS